MIGRTTEYSNVYRFILNGSGSNSERNVAFVEFNQHKDIKL